MSNQKEEETFHKELMTADASHRTAMRLRTPLGFHRFGTGRVSGYRPITSFRPMTGVDGVTRPMTAVRGAGYSSQNKVFDPLNQGTLSTTPPLELPRDESPEENICVQERKIMQLVEESCIASNEGNFRQALDKAEEASNQDQSLIRMQEQAGLEDNHNYDLSYTVLFTLANQYAANELYTEALNTYQHITNIQGETSSMFSNVYRLKINMGNIYCKQGQYQQSIKMYRMALKQVSSSQKNLRIKIMHNIGMVFVRMEQWEEAAASLEAIMNEQASHRVGLHLVLCCIALEDRERMRNSFSLLLSVPLDVEDEEKYSHDQEDINDRLIAAAIRNDELHVHEKKKRADAEFCVLMAAMLISPLIENTFKEGYDWCVSAVKSSEYARLAGNLEINKAVMFLKQGQVSEAIDMLKALSNETNIAGSAAITLSFIYFQQRDYENAEKYGEIIKNIDSYNGAGYVNLGACYMVKNQLEQAKSYFLNALELDPSCFEARYNLGLVLKRQGNYEEALDCYQKFQGSLSLLPEVTYQIACIFEGLGDFEAASEAYQQLLRLVPTDASILQKLGELYDREGDKQQAHHYHTESFRYNPANLSVIDWLGSYYIEMQVIEKALVYFEKATLMQPNEPKWHMMVADCHRRTGNLHEALMLYRDIHKKFPENTECLRFMNCLCSDLAMRDAQDYAFELKKLEKSKEVRDRIGSSRPDAMDTSQKQLIDETILSTPQPIASSTTQKEEVKKVSAIKIPLVFSPNTSSADNVQLASGLDAAECQDLRPSQVTNAKLEHQRCLTNSILQKSTSKWFGLPSFYLRPSNITKDYSEVAASSSTVNETYLLQLMDRLSCNPESISTPRSSCNTDVSSIDRRELSWRCKQHILGEYSEGVLKTEKFTIPFKSEDDADKYYKGVTHMQELVTHRQELLDESNMVTSDDEVVIPEIKADVKDDGRAKSKEDKKVKSSEPEKIKVETSKSAGADGALKRPAEAAELNKTIQDLSDTSFETETEHAVETKDSDKNYIPENNVEIIELDSSSNTSEQLDSESTGNFRLSENSGDGNESDSNESDDEDSQDRYLEDIPEESLNVGHLDAIPGEAENSVNEKTEACISEIAADRISEVLLEDVLSEEMLVISTTEVPEPISDVPTETHLKPSSSRLEAAEQTESQDNLLNTVPEKTLMVEIEHLQDVAGSEHLEVIERDKLEVPQIIADQDNNKLETTPHVVKDKQHDTVQEETASPLMDSKQVLDLSSEMMVTVDDSSLQNTAVLQLMDKTGILDNTHYVKTTVNTPYKDILDESPETCSVEPSRNTNYLNKTDVLDATMCKSNLFGEDDLRSSTPCALVSTRACFEKSETANPLDQADHTVNSQKETKGKGQLADNNEKSVLKSSTPETTVASQRLTPAKFATAHIKASISSGHLVKIFPHYPRDGQTAFVEVSNLHDLLGNDDEYKDLLEFPGPLVKGVSHKKTIIEYCESKIRSAICSRDIADVDSYILMWELLILLLKQNGMVVGTDIAELLMKDRKQQPSRRGSVVSNSSSVAAEGATVSEASNLPVSETHSSSTSILKEDVVTNKFRDYLIYGSGEEALEWAMEHGLWGHAFFLASKLDMRTYANVMTRFANGLTMNDPLQTLYQLLSGKVPASVTCVADEKWGDWRPHLAMILSNTTQRPELDRKAITTLGDTLFSRGSLYAAQFCYLMAQVGFSRYGADGGKLVLLGSNHNKPFLEFANNEAIQMTEVYEYACSLNDPAFIIPEFLPYKYLLATRLADQGLLEKALAYLQKITLTVLQNPSLVQQSLVSQVCQLADRLKYCDPVEEPFEEGDGEFDSSRPDHSWLKDLKAIERDYNMGLITHESVDNFAADTPESDPSQTVQAVYEQQTTQESWQQQYIDPQQYQQQQQWQTLQYTEQQPQLEYQQHVQSQPPDDPTVRDCSSEALGTLKKLAGETAIGPFIAELEKDNLKMTKIRECCEKAVIITKAPAAKKEKPAPTKASAPEKVNSAPAVKAVKRPTTANAKKKAGATISSGTATIVKSRSNKAINEKPRERDLSEEEVADFVSGLLKPETIKGLGDSNSINRLSAMKGFMEEVKIFVSGLLKPEIIKGLEDSNSKNRLSAMKEFMKIFDASSLPTQALVKILNQSPGLKDTNFKVLKARLDAVKYLAENCTFSTTTADECINDVAEILGDPKNGKLAGEVLIAVAAATKFHYVAGLVLDFALTQKSPLVLENSLIWLSSGIKEFGVANLDADMLIEDPKKALASSNPDVCTAYIKLLSTLYLFVGPALEDKILAEFDEIKNEKPPVPTRGALPFALPDEVAINTGEENETVLFAERAKLFRFIKKEWQERGVGTLKILQSKETSKVRILLRRDQVHKICANHFLSKDMTLTPMPNMPRAYFWIANDYADEEIVLEKLCARFKTEEEAGAFYNAFEKAKSSLVEHSDSSSSASSLVRDDGGECNVVKPTETTSLGGFTFTSNPTFKPKEQDQVTVQPEGEKKKCYFLPQGARNQMQQWLQTHAEHPYPTQAEKESFATQISLSQVNDFFKNWRRKMKKPVTK